ncbi:TolC family protein [Hoylesella nanceiensis]|uniref:TolC family protein n=1 Tax=Hoylesella nanceiensis TaxID=425941 RepID=UPI001CB2AE4C|nr:TolC family protein [Hoylesella nanceiensis]MBF1440305.1 TolC family protein [Hoylesella nanceiensis]
MIRYLLGCMAMITTCSLKATATTNTSQPDSLAHYIIVAAKNNPEVASGYHKYQAMVMNAEASGVLPNPELSLSVYPKPMTQENGRQVLTVGVMQMFPWFGTLKATRTMKEKQANAAFQQWREAGIALSYTVQKQWYTLLAKEEQLKYIAQNRQLLNNIKQAMLYQYKSSLATKGSKMSDQLRIEAEDAVYQEKIASIQDEINALKQQFNLLLHRPENSFIALPDTLLARETPFMQWQEVQKNHPALEQLEAQNEAFVAQKELAQRKGMPSFALGVEYMVNQKNPHPLSGAMPDMNGMDMFMPMMKVSLPIYRKKVNAERKAAELQIQATQEAYLRKKDALQTEFVALQQQMSDAKRKIALYNHQISLLNNTLNLLQTEYINGSSSLTDVLQTLREQIDNERKRSDSVAALCLLVAQYEKMISKYDYSSQQ